MTEKLNIFKQYVISIAQPKKYGNMTKLGGGRLFLYTLLLAFVTTFITILPFIVQYFEFGGVEKIADIFIPDFSYENTELDWEEKYDTTINLTAFTEDLAKTEFSTSDDMVEKVRLYVYYALCQSMSTYDETMDSLDYTGTTTELTETMPEDFYLYINTETESISEGISSGAIIPEEIDADCILIVTKTNLTCLSGDSAQDFISDRAYTEYAYSYLFSDNELNKGSIEEMIRSVLPLLYAFFFIFLLIYMMVNLAGWYIAGVVYSIIALIGSKIFKKTLEYGVLFKISMYAQTTAILVMTVIGIVPSIPYTAVNTLFRIVTIAYILPAVYYIKNEKPSSYEEFTYTETVYNSYETEE